MTRFMPAKWGLMAAMAKRSLTLGLPKASPFAGQQQHGRDDDDDNGSPDRKRTKAAANYRPAEGCARCEMFDPDTETCSVVEGRISPVALCDFFEPMDERTEGNERGDERLCSGGRTRRSRRDLDEGGGW
jgi:hypothetical protein